MCQAEYLLIHPHQSPCQVYDLDTFNQEYYNR